MHAPRRLVGLLTSGFLALVAVAPAAAQSPGDQPDAGPSAQAQDAGPAGTLPPLTPEPQTSQPGTPGGGDTGSRGSRSRREAPPPRDASPGSGRPSATNVTRTGLPDTGADADVIGLLGVALMLLGIGLRLRIADVRR